MVMVVMEGVMSWHGCAIPNNSPYVLHRSHVALIVESIQWFCGVTVFYNCPCVNGCEALGSSPPHLIIFNVWFCCTRPPRGLKMVLVRVEFNLHGIVRVNPWIPCEMTRIRAEW